MKDNETGSLFEGIATITTPFISEGNDYDVYAKVTVDTVGQYVRWYGTFEVMGDESPEPGSTASIEFSDGRFGRIDLQGVIDKKGMFHGRGIPPGFTSVPPTPTAEIVSRPNQTFRRILSNTLFAGSAGLLTASLWVEGRGLEFAGTGFIWIVVAIATAPRMTRPLPAIKEDNDGNPDE